MSAVIIVNVRKVHILQGTISSIICPAGQLRLMTEGEWRRVVPNRLAGTGSLRSPGKTMAIRMLQGVMKM